MIKIIIADDHDIVKQGLKMLFQDQTDMCYADDAGSEPELLEKLKKNKYDVLILDICMPESDIFDILDKMKFLDIQMPILVFTMSPEKIYAERLLNAGVTGYLNKNAKPDEILHAIRTVANNEMYVSNEFKSVLGASTFNKNEESKHEILSDREFQVLKLIAEGKALTEISNELFISKATVSNHRTNILKKMNLKNNSDIIQYALKNHII